MMVERKNSSKQNKIGQLTIKVIHLKDLKFLIIQVYYLMKITNTKQIYNKIKTANKIYFMLQTFFRNKNISRRLKLRLKNTIMDKSLTYA